MEGWSRKQEGQQPEQQGCLSRCTQEGLCLWAAQIQTPECPGGKSERRQEGGGKEEEEATLEDSLSWTPPHRMSFGRDRCEVSVGLSLQ